MRISSAAAMEHAGACLAAGLPGALGCARATLGGALMVYLSGDLGAGKTTLVRGALRRLGHAGSVRSPTYTLLESYPALAVAVHHLDLYRLAGPEELELLGAGDYFTDGAVWLVEWPERAAGALAPPDLQITLSLCASGRELRASAPSAAGEGLARCLRQAA